MTNFNFVSVLTFVVVAFSGSVGSSVLPSECGLTSNTMLTSEVTFCTNSAPTYTVGAASR